jgi:hypothetical protein
MLKIATLLLDIGGRGRIVGPLPDLGDPTLMIGSQQFPAAPDLWINNRLTGRTVNLPSVTSGPSRTSTSVGERDGNRDGSASHGSTLSMCGPSDSLQPGFTDP